jgi:tRNA pseudouridine38-40 synthase
MYQGRIRLTVRYDGTGFFGSQIQPGKRTVAGTLKVGLESLLHQEVHLLFAGRTDAGVHAEGNVCAFDANLPYPAERLAKILNAILPEDIQVRESCPALPQFHPRFDALAREYEYSLFRSSDVPVDRMRYVMAYEGEWNQPAVREALDALAGRHAFHCFAEGSLDPRFAKCTLDPVAMRQQDFAVWLKFRGDRFLRQMVRRIVGALIEVATGRVTPEQFTAAVDGRLEFQFKPAPARGLVLLNVDYGMKER